MPADIDLAPPAGLTGPSEQLPFPASVALAELPSPAILRISASGQVAAAKALGFDYLLISRPDLLAEAQSRGFPLLVECALQRPDPGSSLEHEHPDWFVHGPQGPEFRHLSASDETVDWWDLRFTELQRAGVCGMFVRQAHLIAPSIWRRLITAAQERQPETIFIAEIFGATPAQATALEGAGFSFATSSSCYWDFRSGWLNADSARSARIAPLIALAAPPGAQGSGPEQTLRALRLAATFGAGWLMDAGFYQGSGYDFSEEVSALNLLRRAHLALSSPSFAHLRSSPGGNTAALVRGDFVTIANVRLDEPVALPGATLLPTLKIGELHPLQGEENPLTPAQTIELAPGEIRFFGAVSSEPVLLAAPKLDTNAPRIAIEAITPQVDNGKFPVRRILGELVTLEADLLADGHDKLAGEVLFRAADEKTFRVFPLTLLNNDRWYAQIPLDRLGRHIFAVSAWKDNYATFIDEVTKKHAAGVPTQLELREGLEQIEEAARKDKKLRLVLERLRELPEEALREALLSPQMAAAMRQFAPRKHLVRSHEIILDAERSAAAFASWYEIFPRSASGDANRHGTFEDVIGQLPRIAGMGFDVLYFPPIHPIGFKNRKGKNNSLTAGPDDPGSPYAIGCADGGHDAIHPQLGTLEDFQRLIEAAAGFGIEIALDFAIQCAPDHPWLQDHKEWFDWRPDGSLRYAENPPKKYEDIVNVDFYAEGAKPSLWLALRDAVLFWAERGIRLFRVDNPHTKPFPFWEWLIADIRARFPDTAFLAEAFTRPKIMARLGKIGFSQSYSYFTWRNTKPELEEYLNELTTTGLRDYFRPNFFVNTPDINPYFLQNSGRAGHLIRAALGATLSGLWGVYNGFELCEAAPVPGREEYINAEKYEIKAWDYDRPGNIVAEITALNQIRRDNAALHSHLNVTFLPCNNANVLYFRKIAIDGNTLLVAISLDPFNVQHAAIELPTDGSLYAEDLMRDHAFTWYGRYQPVTLNPFELPFCIWRVT